MKMQRIIRVKDERENRFPAQGRRYRLIRVVPPGYSGPLYEGHEDVPAFLLAERIIIIKKIKEKKDG